MTAGDQSTAPAADRDHRALARRAADVASCPGRVGPRPGWTPAVAGQRLAEYGPNELVEKKQRPTWMLLRGPVHQPHDPGAHRRGRRHLRSSATPRTRWSSWPSSSSTAWSASCRSTAPGRPWTRSSRCPAPTARVVRDGEIRAACRPRRSCPATSCCWSRATSSPPTCACWRRPALKINEAPLTGESEPVAKVTEPLPEVGAATPADQRNMAFSGTAVTYGRARGLVVSTGMSTAIGRIAELLQEGEDEATPLQQRLGQLGKWLAIAAIAHLRGRLRPGRGARRAGGGDVPGRGLAGGGGHPRGSAGGRDHLAGTRCPSHGRPTGAGATAAGGRDAGLGHRHLHRQDRHPDREPHARGAAVDAGAASTRSAATATRPTGS